MDFALTKNSTDYIVRAAKAQALQEAERAEKFKNNPQAKQIEAAAQDFEAVFLSEMIKPMFEEIETDPMFGGGKGEDVFRGILVQEYGKIMSESGGVGIADFVRDEMIRIQEEASKQNPLQSGGNPAPQKIGTDYAYTNINQTLTADITGE